MANKYPATYINASELAGRWDLSVMTIIRRIEAKEIPAFNLGKGTNYRISMEWIEEHERKAVTKTITGQDSDEIINTETMPEMPDTTDEAKYD